jgi:hypothetical protein
MVTVGSMANSAKQHAFGEMVDLDRFSEVLGEGETVGAIDLGSASISKVIHPVLGVLMMVNTDGGGAVIITAAMLS